MADEQIRMQESAAAEEAAAREADAGTAAQTGEQAEKSRDGGRRRPRKAEVLVLAGLMLAGGALGLFLLLNRQEGTKVQVSVSGQIVAEYPLSRDRTEVIEGAGGGTNTLVIEDGMAWLTDSTCPDHLCEYMGKISQNYEVVICLPNEVVVQVIEPDGGSDDGVDVVAG